MPLRRHPAFPRLACLHLACLCLLAGAVGTAAAQGVCSSEHQPRPTLLVERFLPDRCDDCWRTAPAPTPKGAVVADWVVPSGDTDAPLGAAALDESAQRLQALGLAPDSRAAREARHTVSPAAAGRLRLAQGPVVNDYLGVSARWKPVGRQLRRLDARVLLVEDIPAGVAGSPVARVLVRGAWTQDDITPGSQGWSDRRAMRVPAGADPARLRLVGWLADADGQVLAAATTRCQP